ncbi:D-2-hydroxyacid dehydrogenase family protein [Nocardioides sp. NPDC051685]|uniref:D-2-hydroxyacid dehydrogenase family protein n=1 Tax=Nocardioides sp. NPDC051685 TaxID=3364334 RepID=UPI0037A4775B
MSFEGDSGMKVAVIHDYLGVAERMADWSRVRALAELDFFTAPFDDDDVVAQLAGYDVICAMRERLPLTAALMDRLPRLKMYVATSERNRVIDFDAARERGIEIAATPSGGLARAATAELAWGLLLAASRGIVAEDRAVRDGTWQTMPFPSLYGRTIGIVGLGGVGRYIARYAHAFGMSVLAWSPHLAEMACVEAGATKVELDDLLQLSDVVTLHIVASESTRHLIDARALALMKPTAVLVNTSRGALVDEVALVDALRLGRLRAAALDVFEREPLHPDDPLTKLDNALLSPHSAGFTEETYQVWYQGTVDAVVAFLEGREIPIRHLPG